eukprot:3437719-Amphidinium_carterae.1
MLDRGPTPASVFALSAKKLRPTEAICQYRGLVRDDTLEGATIVPAGVSAFHELLRLRDDVLRCMDLSPPSQREASSERNPPVTFFHIL